MAAQAKNKKKTGALRPQLTKKQKYMQIVKECVEGKVSLVDLVDKWKVNANAIIDSVQKAGLVVPPECKVWSFFRHKSLHDFVRCKECASRIKTRNVMKHFAKCHKGANINDGSCAVCKENVRMDALQFHHYCAQNPHLSVSGPPQNPHFSASRPPQNPHLSSSGPPQNPHSLSPSPSPPQKRQRHQPSVEPGHPSSRLAMPNEWTENTRNVQPIYMDHVAEGPSHISKSSSFSTTGTAPQRSITQEERQNSDVTSQVFWPQESSTNDEDRFREEGEILSDEDLPTHNTSCQREEMSKLTPEQWQQIVKECVQEEITPGELARKWKCNPDTIRSKVRTAGLTLPMQYKKTLNLDSANFKEISAASNSEAVNPKRASIEKSCEAQPVLAKKLAPKPTASSASASAATVSQATSSVSPAAATASPSAGTVSPAASSEAPAYTIWSVLPGACSFVQCPECPRKLPLDNVHHHLVRKKLF